MATALCPLHTGAKSRYVSTSCEWAWTTKSTRRTRVKRWLILRLQTIAGVAIYKNSFVWLRSWRCVEPVGSWRWKRIFERTQMLTDTPICCMLEGCLEVKGTQFSNYSKITTVMEQNLFDLDESRVQRVGSWMRHGSGSGTLLQDASLTAFRPTQK